MIICYAAMKMITTSMDSFSWKYVTFSWFFVCQVIADYILNIECYIAETLDFFTFLWRVLGFCFVLSWKVINLIWFSNWKICLNYGISNLSSIFQFLSIIQHLGRVYTQNLGFLFPSSLIIIFVWQWPSWAVIWFLRPEKSWFFYWNFNFLPLVQSLHKPGNQTIPFPSFIQVLTSFQNTSAFVHYLYP